MQAKRTRKKKFREKNAPAENKSCTINGPKIVNLLTPNVSSNDLFLSCCELISLLSCLPRYILI